MTRTSLSNLSKPLNDGYSATVVRVASVIPLSGCDNVVGTTFFGYQAIVSKDTAVGDIGIVFTAETQLSHEYAWYNNLYRHPEKNSDPSQKGYLEDNRRVKAMKFRGHQSDALFMPLESLEFVNSQESLSPGDTFDHLDGKEVCRKYVRPTDVGHNNLPTAKLLRSSRVNEKFLPQHFDTDNYFKNSHKIDPWKYVTLTQKLHGTSIRVGNIPVKRSLKWYEKLAKRFGVKVDEFEYDYVYGSRKVIKDANNPNQNHFYTEDIYSRKGSELKGLLPQGFVVYGELIGWTEGGQPIQKGYTYKLPKGQSALHIYRVTYVNPEGFQVDLSWPAVKEFCNQRGLYHVPEVDEAFLHTIDVRSYLDVALYKGRGLPAGLLPVDTVDEGVCIRSEGITPTVLKAKSPMFLAHESKLLDDDTVVDMEAQESDGPSEAAGEGSA